MLLGRKKWERLEKEKQEKDLPSPLKEETTIDIFATDETKRTNVKPMTAAQKQLVQRWNIWRNENATMDNKHVTDKTNKTAQQPKVEEILDEEEGMKPEEIVPKAYHEYLGVFDEG